MSLLLLFSGLPETEIVLPAILSATEPLGVSFGGPLGPILLPAIASGVEPPGPFLLDLALLPNRLQANA